MQWISTIALALVLVAANPASAAASDKPQALLCYEQGTGEQTKIDLAANPGARCPDGYRAAYLYDITDEIRGVSGEPAPTVSLDIGDGCAWKLDRSANLLRPTCEVPEQ